MIPAFTEDERAFILELRRYDIHITPDGRITVRFQFSPEYAAKLLHDRFVAKDPP